jgi:hypothetical protein
MLVSDMLTRLLDSEVFRDWKKAHESDYLVHFLKIIENDPVNWFIGFYNKGSDTITSFELGEIIIINPEEKVFKEQGIVKELLLEQVKFDFEDAVSTARKLQQEKYSAHEPFKIITILQHLESIVWNLTMVTNTFNTINVKVDASSGKVIHEELSSLMDLKAKDQ